MTFLPIVERELRVAARRRSTYLGRLAGAVVAMVVGGWLMLVMDSASPGQIGKALFISLSVMLFIYSLAAGARITSDCLSEEKREGTLGLLFLTDLKGYDIVAGKLVANSVNTFYGLLAAFPVLAISLLMGGVTSAEFWRVTLVATNLLFFSLSAGMFASAICRDERKAMSLAFLLILLVLGITPLIGIILSSIDHHRAATITVWLMPSPAFACFTAFGSRIGFKPADFWTPVAMTHGYAWIFLVLASSIVPRSWQDKAAKSATPFRDIWRKLFKAEGNKEASRRTHLLEINPFLWLVARDPLKTIFLWSVLFVLSVAWVWVASKWPDVWMSLPSYVFMAVLLHTVLKFWLASEACFRFVQDRKSGALELLLSTPLSVKEILRGQRLALFRLFAGPVIYILLVDLLFLLFGLGQQSLNHGDERTDWVMLWLVGMTVFVMDLFALSWVSMWVGLSSKKANRAANAAVARVLVLPWMAFFFLMTAIATASIFSKIRLDENVILLLWLALAVINNLFFLNWAKNNLRNRLREVATQRFAPTTSRFVWMKSNSAKKPPELPPVIHG